MPAGCETRPGTRGWTPFEAFCSGVAGAGGAAQPPLYHIYRGERRGVRLFEQGLRRPVLGPHAAGAAAGAAPGQAAMMPRCLRAVCAHWGPARLPPCCSWSSGRLPRPGAPFPRGSGTRALSKCSALAATGKAAANAASAVAERSSPVADVSPSYDADQIQVPFA